MALGNLIGAGVGAAVGIANSIASAASAKKARKQLDKGQAFNQNMFNKRYYEDMMQRDEIQNALNAQQQIMDNQARMDAASSVISGATPEMQMAMQNNRNANMSGTISNIASNMMNYKDSIMNNYQNSVDNYFKSKADSFGNQSNQQAQAAANGFQAMGQSLSGVKLSDFKK